MKIIFATTNKRKIEDVLEIIKENNLDISLLTLDDILFQEEIEETGTTLRENSFIKAKTILEYCKKHGFNYPILADDAGLFIDALNGEPGIYTARYADLELKNDPSLPKYQCIIKVLDKMKNVTNRKAVYKAIATYMSPDGNYFQEEGESAGYIAEEIVEPIKKPYFYSIFCLEGKEKTFNQMTKEELSDTYRYQVMKKILTKATKYKH